MRAGSVKIFFTGYFAKYWVKAVPRITIFFIFFHFVSMAGENSLIPEIAGENPVIPETAGENYVIPETAGENCIIPATAGENSVIPETAGEITKCRRIHFRMLQPLALQATATGERSRAGILLYVRSFAGEARNAIRRKRFQ